MRKSIAFIISCALIPVAYFFVCLDNWAGGSQRVFFELLFISIGVEIGALVLLLGRHKALVVLPSAYVLFLLVLPVLELSPVKPAVRAVNEIRPGMTESQVRAVLDRRFPAHGRFKRPEMGTLHGGVLSFVLDPNDGRYNAAIVRIKFAAEKCVSAEFLPD